MPRPPTQSDSGDSSASLAETVIDTKIALSEGASAGHQTSGDGIARAADIPTEMDTDGTGAGSDEPGASRTGTAGDSRAGQGTTLVDPLLAGSGGADTDSEAGRATVGESTFLAAGPVPGPIRVGPMEDGRTTPSGRGGGGIGGDRDGDEVGGRYVLIGVGDYKAPLGQGAFGEVWQAHDSEFDREVALKILKPRMCRPAVLLRFELEKQVVARMEHPNIAKVYEGGTFKDGRPFLAMELIRGKTLTDFCNGRQLAVAERLRLFVQICRAVHHAHERFVLHRDLKPSNIMVVEQDGVVVPKVIDFGIAKVLEEGEFSADPAPTQEGSLKGTPAYMSPEQTRGNEGLTARSDIYTLGVILYELLTGDTPLSHDRTRKLDFVSVISAIRNEEPSFPSATVTKRDVTPSRAKLKCGLPPARLSRHLRGDLDVIVLRTLEKEPARRYASAAELAADIERHLGNEPILARPPGAWYRAGKFVRRHRAATAAAAAVLAALVATAAVSTWSYFSVNAALGRESVARLEAVQKRREADIERVKADAAKAVAEQKEAEARMARDAAIVARGEAEDLINYMLFDLREQLEPLGRSRLLASVAEKAEQYFSKQTTLTDNDSLARNRAVMFYNRGRILLAQGAVAQALTAFQKARAAMEKRSREADDAARRFDLATASHGLGLALRASGTPDEARPMFEESLPFLRSRHAEHDADAGRLLAANLEQLGEMKLRAGKPDAALELFREQEARARELRAAALREKRTALALAVACEKVGGAWQQLGRPDEALPKFEEEVALLHALAGESLDDLMLRRSYIVSLEKLGNVLLALKRPEEARKHYEERLRESEVLARVDPRRIEFRRDLAVAHQRLSVALLQLGRNAEALDHARTDLQLTATLAGENPLDAGIRGDLAASRFQVGLVLLKDNAMTPARLNEAKDELEQAAKILRSLATDGKIDQRGITVLAELEKALTDLAKARGGGTGLRNK